MVLPLKKDRPDAAEPALTEVALLPEPPAESPAEPPAELAAELLQAATSVAAADRKAMPIMPRRPILLPLFCLLLLVTT
jgi:hypothetical protein